MIEAFDRHYKVARRAQLGEGRMLSSATYVEALEYACRQLGINPETGADANVCHAADEYDDIIKAQELLENPSEGNP